MFLLEDSTTTDHRINEMLLFILKGETGFIKKTNIHF